MKSPLDIRHIQNVLMDYIESLDEGTEWELFIEGLRTVPTIKVKANDRENDFTDWLPKLKTFEDWVDFFDKLADYMLYLAKVRNRPLTVLKERL